MGVGAKYSLFHSHNTIISLPHTSEHPGLRETEMKLLFGDLQGGIHFGESLKRCYFVTMPSPASK